MHLVIFNHIQQHANEPGTKLQSLITIWEETMRDENTNELTRAILATVIFVAKILHQDRALLLPQAVTIFLDNSPSFSEEQYLELSYRVFLKVATTSTNNSSSTIYEIQMCHQTNWHTHIPS